MSVQQTIIDKIQRKGRGHIYCLEDFLDMGTRNAVAVAVFRLVRKNVLKNAGPGLYEYPKISRVLGPIMPDLNSILKSYARKNKCLITLDPLAAAHMLHLTTQVPAKLTYLTDGISRTLKIRGVQVKLVHTCPKKLAGIGKKAGLIIQALRYFGNKPIPDIVLKKIIANMNKKDQNDLKKLRLKTMKSLIPSIDKILSYA